MGKLLKGWALVREVLGPYLTDRLRNGLPIDIAAENGQIYRIDPKIKKLVNLTTWENYCVHPVDGEYCFPDMVIVWWDYIHLKVGELEKAVGGPNDGHRSMAWNLDPIGREFLMQDTPVMREAMEHINFDNRGIIHPNLSKLLTDPFRALNYLPSFMVQKIDYVLSSVSMFYNDGSLSGSVEVQEVVQDVEEIEEIADGECQGNLEESLGE